MEAVPKNIPIIMRSINFRLGFVAKYNAAEIKKNGNMSFIRCEDCHNNCALNIISNCDVSAIL